MKKGGRIFELRDGKFGRIRSAEFKKIAKP